GRAPGAHRAGRPADVLSSPRRARGTVAAAALAAELAPDLVLLVDDQERITYANGRLFDLLGFPYLPFLALDLLLEEPSLGRLKGLIGGAEEGCPTEAVPIAWRRKEGGPRTLEVRVARADGQTAIVAREPDARCGREQRLVE